VIRAIIFDLDGTLVKTEQLKARSYGCAAGELSGGRVTEDAVMAAFKEVVGRSRREVAEFLLDRFELEEAARVRMEEFDANEPWQAYVRLRLRHYRRLMSDPETVRGNTWPHTMDLLEWAQETACRVGLATMSYCEQVSRILDLLNLSDSFDFVATLDDVEQGKPDPEIYHLVARCLDVEPEQCIVIEDSPAGVEAALRARMHCVAVTTPFTFTALHASGLLPETRIVDEPNDLRRVVDGILEEQRHAAAAAADVNEHKRRAARRAVELVEPGMVIGLGHGSTAAHVLSSVAERYASGELAGLVCIPCSRQTADAARAAGLPLGTPDDYPEVDLTIDGADEVDPGLNLIKGGGGALLREKLVAQIRRREVIVVDASKLSKRLGEQRAVPVEVVPFAATVERRRIASLGARVELRHGTDGVPFRTDQGHLILDCAFGPIEDPIALAAELVKGAGVVEHGLFLGLATDLVVAGSDGVSHRRREYPRSAGTGDEGTTGKEGD
jgi:ribose 5-phosphate isomerase A